MKKSDLEKSKELAMVISYYNYEIEGETFKIVCPFHKDVNPSLLVNLNTGIWTCFGCRLCGDAFDFVKYMEAKYHKKNDLQSLVLFRKIIHNKVKRSKIEKIINFKKENKSNSQYLIEATDFYYCLPQIDWGDYRLDDDQVEARQYMTKRGFKIRVLNEIGCKYNYSRNYRIILPMMDNETFKGWVCRTTDKKIEDGGRKYLYNKGFSRATTLVGNYGDKDYVFIVEGFMDRLKLYQFGIKNSVAILGWKLSGSQIQKLKDAGVTKIICCLDSDEKGKEGYKYCKNFFKTYRFQYGYFIDDKGSYRKAKDIGELKKKDFINMLQKTLEKYKIKL